MDYCYICEQYTYIEGMEKHQDGHNYCGRCSFIPPYSDALYNAIVGVQRLFRSYYEKKAKPCGRCGGSFLHLQEFHAGLPPICQYCVDEEIEEMRQEYEEERECPHCYNDPCRCEEDDGPCEDCGNPWQCVCLEQVEEAELKRHRRICGDRHCDGSCGTLSCGCIDKCKCDDHY